MTLFIFLVGLAYLMGSFCSAIIVCRIFGLPDPREEGSKNPGATNVLRLAGKKYAALVMVGDVLKGTIPVLIAKMLHAEPVTVAFTALAAVIGHMYPIFFKFKGGKGVATALGAMLGFHFIVGVMISATWLLVANFTRYSSLASIVAIIMAPFYSLWLVGRLDIFPPIFFITLLVLYKHRNNINRLIDGVEPKIKLKQAPIKNIIKSSSPAANEETPPAVEITPSPVKKKAAHKTKSTEKKTKSTKAAPETTSKKTVKTEKETTKIKPKTKKTKEVKKDKKDKKED